MPSERWTRVEQLFGDAIALPAEQRATFLASATHADRALRDEVDSLLNAVERSGPFLSSTALATFAAQISREGWTVQRGDRIGCYLVERRLGAGGMGEVWRARDERLGRDVAIKLLLPRPGAEADRDTALLDEARAASALNHTNVLTVYDVGDHHGAPYLVTECLEGRSLRARLGDGALDLDLALDIAAQVARGLAAAHARGIIHCDLKPENIFLGADGRVKILDFGLAMLHRATRSARGATTRSPLLGTARYMAPEQRRGEPIDHRADLFALGLVLREMVAGRPPGDSAADRDVPAAIAPLLRRCLAPAAADRVATADAVGAELDAMIAARQPTPPSRLRRLLRQPIVMAGAVGLLAALALLAWRWQAAAARVRWAHDVAAPRARQLAEEGHMGEAYFLLREARDVAPSDPLLQQSWLDVTLPQTVRSDPAGAEVAVAPYRGRAPAWVVLGTTPLAIRLPRGQIRMRLSKAGYAPIEVAREPSERSHRLDPSGSAPPGMVRVTGGPFPEWLGTPGRLDDFWIDRLEVTNRQFKAFVDQGGYRRSELWREPFVDGDHTLSWPDAMRRFTDRTGQHGPSTWSAGTYPAGHDDFPAEGVSWYEAAAYAVFAGRQLPTMAHWTQATRLGRFADILSVSNFGGTGAVAAGSAGGLGPFGTEDMAGNVREWCSTDLGGRRALLGGSWDGPRYVFGGVDAGNPFERGPGIGFRLAAYAAPLPAAVTGPVRLAAVVRDGRQARPVSDEVFAEIRRSYAYDRRPLNAAIESTETTASFVHAVVTFDAAYGGERERAHLFLPRRALPPYQTVVLFPAGDAFQLRSSRDMSLAWVSLVVESGRALLYPIYKGTYERQIQDTPGEQGLRELRIAWSRDLGRAIDYLETRPDIDRTRVAYWGVSSGADAGVPLCALEPRLRTAILLGTGIWGDDTSVGDNYNYAPRLRMPVLLLNGRYDFSTPVETAQVPLFDLLGTPAADKRHVVFETGHALPLGDVAREMLPWLDRYLGRVTSPGSALTPTTPVAR